MFESALVPVSFREPVQRIKALTDFLRNFSTQTVVLVHVVSSGLERGGQARQRLESLAEQVVSDAFKIRCLVRTGSPALEITRVAAERRIQFICVPWKKKEFLQRSLLGSTTQDLARLTDVPLFVYKQQRTLLEKAGKLETLLYSTTFDPSHDRIFPVLRGEGLKAETLCILHVGWRAPDPEADAARRKIIAEKLGALEQRCSDCYENVSSVVEVGNPKRKILKVAREHDADLIVLGKHEQGRALSRMLGSTAERIIHRAKASILIVPAYELQQGSPQSADAAEGPSSAASAKDDLEGGAC